MNIKQSALSPFQVSIAGMYNIPINQAHTINVNKAKAYFKHLMSPEMRLEFYLNSLFNHTEKRRKAEWF